MDNGTQNTSSPFALAESRILQDLQTNPNDMQSVYRELEGLKNNETDTDFQKDMLKINQDLHKAHLLPYFELIEAAPDQANNHHGFDIRNLLAGGTGAPLPPMESTPPSGNYQGSGTGPDNRSGGGQDGAVDGGDGNGSANGSGGGDVSAIADPGGDTWDGQSQGDMDLSTCAAGDLGKQLWAETPWANSCDNGNEGCAASVSKVLEEAGITYAANASVVGLAQQLTSNGWSQSSGVDSAEPGTVIYGDKGGGDQHIGIVGLDRGQLVVYNNWSNDGKWHEEPLKSSYIATHFAGDVHVLHPPQALATHVAAPSAPPSAGSPGKAHT